MYKMEITVKSGSLSKPPIRIDNFVFKFTVLIYVYCLRDKYLDHSSHSDSFHMYQHMCNEKDTDWYSLSNILNQPKTILDCERCSFIH